MQQNWEQPTWPVFWADSGHCLQLSSQIFWVPGTSKFLGSALQLWIHSHMSLICSQGLPTRTWKHQYTVWSLRPSFQISVEATVTSQLCSATTSLVPTLGFISAQIAYSLLSVITINLTKNIQQYPCPSFNQLCNVEISSSRLTSPLSLNSVLTKSQGMENI